MYYVCSGGGGVVCCHGVVLPALLAFLPSVIFSFFTQNKGDTGPRGPLP